MPDSTALLRSMWHCRTQSCGRERGRFPGCCKQSRKYFRAHRRQWEVALSLFGRPSEVATARAPVEPASLVEGEKE